MKGSDKLNKTIVLASHGNLAEGMLSAIEMIMGKPEKTYAFGLSKYHSPEAISQEVEKLQDDLLILICDLKGGSVYNRLIEFGIRKNVMVISGMNLGLSMELILTQFDEDYQSQIEDIISGSRDSIELFNFEKALSEFEKEADRLW